MIKLTIDNILTLYKIMVDNTGGTIGIRDTSLLESALNAPFQTFGDEELFPSIKEKASRLCYGLIKNHPFIDGNKRIGVYAMLVFLELNNLNLNFSDEEISEMLSVHYMSLLNKFKEVDGCENNRN